MTQPTIDGVGHGVPRMLYASDGSNWYAILVDADGHVKVDIVSAALGTDGATATNQATMITALQLIDDLRNALGSVNTDDLQVDIKTYPGSNVLGNIPFGYNNQYLEIIGSGDAPAGWNFFYGAAVPAGEIWIINSISAWDTATNPTAIYTGIHKHPADYQVNFKASPGLNIPFISLVPLLLKEPDQVYVYFEGCSLHDALYATITGYKMKVA